LPDEQSVPFPHAESVGRRSHGSGAGAKGRETILPAKSQRNPLKTLYSHERFQGNPNFGG
jgi:hypothetical protein